MALEATLPNLVVPAKEEHGAGSPAIRAGHPPRFYRPELDLLRLLAFVMVWLAHALIPFHHLLPSGFLVAAEGAGSCGVPVFFFLSAYLVTELLRRERVATGTFDLPHFYLRRVLRIWPLYFGVLAAYGLLGLRFHGFRIEPGRLAASLLLAGNWYIVLHPTITTPMRALWSISVEEQWYLLWPPVLRRLNRIRLLTLCGVLMAAAQLTLIFLAQPHQASMLQVTAWDNTVVQFQYFAYGAAAALLLDGRIPRLDSVFRVLLAALGAVALIAASSLSRFKEAAVPHSAGSLVSGYLLAAVGTAAFFFALLGLTPERCPRLLVRFGQISFGLYVFHETGFFLANAIARHLGTRYTIRQLVLEKLLALAFAIGLAFLSYRYWELPFLRLKQRFTVIRTREAR